MHINFPNSTVKQGKIESATIYLDEPTAQKFLANKIAGQTLADTIYLLEIGPFTKSDNNFEAEAKVLFLKVPDTKVLYYKSELGEFPITWSQVEITPTEASQELIFERFTIPAKKDLFLWLAILIVCTLLLIAILKFRKMKLLQGQIRKRRQNLRDELLGGTNYFEVVEVWKKREQFLAEFPEVTEHFKKFEQNLFKYQFKPFQSETEKIEIMQAYREFTNNVRGGLSGI